MPSFYINEHGAAEFNHAIVWVPSDQDFLVREFGKTNYRLRRSAAVMASLLTLLPLWKGSDVIKLDSESPKVLENFLDRPSSGNTGVGFLNDKSYLYIALALHGRVTSATNDWTVESPHKASRCRNGRSKIIEAAGFSLQHMEA